MFLLSKLRDPGPNLKLPSDLGAEPGLLVPSNDHPVKIQKTALAAPSSAHMQWCPTGRAFWEDNKSLYACINRNPPIVLLRNLNN